MTHRKRHRRFKLRSLYNWHRYLGLTAALFVLLLSITGIMLNHTEDLGLDERHVASEWLLDAYGIEAPRAMRSFRAGPFHVTQAEERLFIDARMLEEKHDHGADALAGAVFTGELLVIALRDALLLYTADGEFIEALNPGHGLPAGIGRIGTRTDGGICVRAADGVYATDADFNQWRRDDCTRVRWATPAALPESLAEAIRAAYRHDQISWERVTLDLHSGRLFGDYGVLVMDAAALLFVFLAGSGILLWLIRIHKQREHRRHRPKSH